MLNSLIKSLIIKRNSIFISDEMKHFIEDLKHLIEHTFIINRNKRVVLIGHSMGNPYILYLLNHQSQKWKDKYIHSFISLASPWAGAAKTFRLMTSGRY